jgi:hypothetical protein
LGLGLVWFGVFFFFGFFFSCCCLLSRKKNRQIKQSSLAALTSVVKTHGKHKNAAAAYEIILKVGLSFVLRFVVCIFFSLFFIYFYFFAILSV